MSFDNELTKLGRELSEMNEGLKLVWDVVYNLANIVETGQKAMVEDLKTMLGTFVSTFIACHIK